jgi:hypothetical protein
LTSFPRSPSRSRKINLTRISDPYFRQVFRKRADLKWHGYPPTPCVGSIEKFLALVAEDKHGCFFG